MTGEQNQGLLSQQQFALTAITIATRFCQQSIFGEQAKVVFLT
jgi:hypothetical protein